MNAQEERRRSRQLLKQLADLDVWESVRGEGRVCSAFMVIGAKHKVTVGEVEKNHKDEVRSEGHAVPWTIKVTFLKSMV